MEQRHNENQKMNERIRAEENKKASEIAKNLSEREEMEKLSRLKFRIGLTYLLKEPKKYNSFTVYLHVPLGEQEIRKRMISGFGDI